MHRDKKSDFKQTQLASLQVELGKANPNKASFGQIDLNLRATVQGRGGEILFLKTLVDLSVPLHFKLI